jgi:hypothetical protein
MVRVRSSGSCTAHNAGRLCRMVTKAADTDSVLRERGVDAGLRFYDGTTHLSMVSLPKYARI